MKNPINNWYDKNMKIVLNQHIELMIKELRKISSNIEAIILYGGYGRCEGSWIIGSDGKYRPYNDYDILLIVENKISIEQIEFSRKDLAKQIGIRWVDIEQKTISELKKSKPTIFNYDLKNASRVIFGDPDILMVVPDINAARLPLKEGETLFFTRLWTLLGALEEDSLNTGLKGDASCFFRNQMAKAVLAVVDIKLLKKGAYHSSYRQRVERFFQHYSGKKELCELAGWALEEKLFPRSVEMSAQEVKQLYTIVHHHFLKEMYDLLTHYYGQKVDCPESVKRYLKWSFMGLIKRFAMILLRFNLNWEKKVVVNLAQVFIVDAYNNDDNFKTYLAKGIKYIRQIDRSFSKFASWDEARIKVAQLRMEA